MQHLINKALTHAANHWHGSAGHNQDRDSAPKAADVQLFGGPNPIEGGRLYTHQHWSSTGVLNLSRHKPE